MLTCLRRLQLVSKFNDKATAVTQPETLNWKNRSTDLGRTLERHRYLLKQLARQPEHRSTKMHNTYTKTSLYGLGYNASSVITYIYITYRYILYNVPQCMVPCDASPQWMGLDKTYLGYKVLDFTNLLTTL